MNKEYCMTLVRVVEGDAEEVAHTHVDAPDERHALLELLAACIRENVSVAGCAVVVATNIDIPADLMAYAEKARVLNHGASPQRELPPMYCDPGSPHFH